MAGKYTSYVSVKSGNNNTFLGELPLQGAGASAFSYQKNIVVDVFLSNFGSTIVRNLVGDWEIELLANNAPDAKVLFRQKVKWTAQVVAIVDPFFGSLGMVTWLPLGDGGSGKQQTSICNGEECAVIEDPTTATEAEWTAYGETGAWRFLDNPFIDKWSPQDKYKEEQVASEYNVEKGFTIFTPEGAATLGTYKFFAKWQSAIIGYNCAIPDGALLHVITDKWQFSSLSREATYQFAFKAAIVNPNVLFSRNTGETWLFYPDGENVKCSRTRRIESHGLNDDPVVTDSAPGSIIPMRQDGRIFVLLGEAGNIKIVESTNSGFEWEKEVMITDNINVIGGAGDKTGSTFYAFGFASKDIEDSNISNGDPVRAVIKMDTSNGSSTWSLEKIDKIEYDGELPFKKTFSGVTNADSVYWAWFMDGGDLECWRVMDGFLNWSLIETG